MTFFFVSRSSQKKVAVLLFWRLHIQVAFFFALLLLLWLLLCWGFSYSRTLLFQMASDVWERERDENSVLRAVSSLLFSFFVAFVFTYSFTMQIASLFFFLSTEVQLVLLRQYQKKNEQAFFFGLGALLFNSLLLCIFRHNSLFFCFCYFISGECFFLTILLLLCSFFFALQTLHLLFFLAIVVCLYMCVLHFCHLCASTYIKKKVFIYTQHSFFFQFVHFLFCLRGVMDRRKALSCGEPSSTKQAFCYKKKTRCFSLVKPGSISII